MTKLKRNAVIGLVLCSVLALGGCGNANNEQSSTTPSVSSDSAAAAESTTSSSESASQSASELTPQETPSTEFVSDSSTPAPAESVSESSIQAETPPSTPAVDKSYLNNIPALPNKSGGCGFSAANGRDSKNVPNDMYWYVKKYGKYNADFLQDTNKNVIYLTMDEGYEAGYTPTILDTLKEKNVKAVFFLTKQFIDSDPQLVQRMIDEGHVIGNHTVSHKAMPTLSLEQQTAEITTINNIIKDQFGYDVKLFRFPEGEFSEQSLALAESLGMRSVFWSFAHKDFDREAQPDPTASLQKCLNEVHPGAIYLLHAVSSTNTQILGDFIDGVRAKGFEFGVYPVQ
ncbi:MAG: polysaccharide deacetylase family protein [Clostridiales bacterium]|nr:polysaccharide deacetylase family protein [Clostridiales bacterium]